MQHHANEVHYPTGDLLRNAHLRSMGQYQTMYAASLSDPDAFWREQASKLHFEKSWTEPICRYNFDIRQGPISISWCEGATTNLCYNSLDRHIAAGHGDRIAFLWEGNEEGQSRTVTYQQLLDEVQRIGSWLISVGCGAGSDVTIYMPVVPELPAAMLACARIGAIHSVVFGGFSAEALSGRILDSRAKVVITASAAKRGAKVIGLKAIVDEALLLTERAAHHVESVLVYDHTLCQPDRSTIKMKEGRDVWWQDAVSGQPSDACPLVWMDAEAPLFKLYTSGSTGTPKGVVHTTAGYMIGSSMTFKYVFDYHDADIYWCTADCGWITGHSYVVYGPLIHGATQVLFEGIPTHPTPSRCWDIVDKHKVTILYTAPTLVRALQALGDAHVTKHSRKSLRLLGSVGEPINPEAWNWYYEVVGDSRCPIMDTWWQTETGSHMLTPLPGVTPLKPGSATLPFFGVEPAVLDDKGNELQGECEGVLVIKRPVPSMMRTLAGDHARFEQTYFSTFPGYYFTGDGCRRDADGYYWINGRVDDVINVSGHRIGTAEVESALVEHDECVEAAVVAKDHPIKGQCIYAFVTLMQGVAYPPTNGSALRGELTAMVRKIIGALATPDVIHWAPALPKTRSGKIMRRILRKIAAGEEDQLGDVSTLADPTVVTALIQLRGK